MNMPQSPALYTSRYGDLKGIDFSCDPTECDRKRSPDALNMVSDNGGNPVKRRGWRVKHNLNCGNIHKLFFNSGVKYIIADTGIWKIDKENKVAHVVAKEINNADIVTFNSKVYAFADGYYELGDEVKDMLVEPYIPEMVISRNPNGSGGTFLESVNMLTPKRKVSFLGDSTAKEYYLVPKKDTTEDKYKYIIADSIKVEAQNATGIFEVITDYTKPTVTEVQGLSVNGELKTFSVCAPYITFSAAKPPIIPGQDNVRITYESFDATLKDGNMLGQYNENRVKLLKTYTSMTYGFTADDRIFCVTDKNKIYYSAVNKADYFPDDNYIVVGHSGEIKGLHRVGEYLAAIKGDSMVESTVFLIYGTTLDGDTVFGAKSTIGGIGAASGESFATLIDEPLFLSATGVYAITNQYTTTEKILRNRSYFIDKKLCSEPSLDKAIGVTWNRYYILCINSHCYVLDGRQTANDRYNNTDYLYEAYYWDNIPAVAFEVYENELWFGTDDGRLCKFNTDVKGITAYCDDGEELYDSDGRMFLDGGVAIKSKWSTPADGDGKIQYYKNLNKKGTVITLLPHDRSSVSVYYSVDGNPPVFIGKALTDIFNWENIDFERFTFNSNAAAQDIYTNRKVKKYRRIQFVFENNEIYEPFGLIEFTKTYTVGNFSK